MINYYYYQNLNGIAQNSSFLINSNISHDEIVLINDVLKEFYDVKEGIKNSNDKYKFKLYVETVPFY